MSKRREIASATAYLPDKYCRNLAPILAKTLANPSPQDKIKDIMD